MTGRTEGASTLRPACCHQHLPPWAQRQREAFTSLWRGAGQVSYPFLQREGKNGHASQTCRLASSEKFYLQDVVLGTLCDSTHTSDMTKSKETASFEQRRKLNKGLTPQHHFLGLLQSKGGRSTIACSNPACGSFFQKYSLHLTQSAFLLSLSLPLSFSSSSSFFLLHEKKY